MRPIIFALFLAISSPVLAQGAPKPLELADGAPDRHIVVPGDTLWAIAARFLKDPYRWGELWKFNKDEVRNPQRIYPGQVLRLERDTDGPRLVLETIKLRPHEYVESLKKAIPSIPPQVIEPFLIEPLVVEKDALDTAARVVAIQDNRVIAGAGDRVFATNVSQSVRQWHLYRPGSAMKDPDSGDVLGYEAELLGTAQLAALGNPAEFMIRSSKLEVVRGDHLLPSPHPDVFTYIPRAPEKSIRGRVVGIRGGAANFSGRDGVIAIGRGKADGVEAGHVFALDLAGAEVDDRFKEQKTSFRLPDQKNGLIFVFRVFDRVSYALVMEAGKPVRVGDVFHTP